MRVRALWRWLALVGALCLLAGARPLRADPLQYVGLPVEQARIEMLGFYPSSPEQIARLLELRPGAPLSPFLLERNILLLYALGDVENIAVEVRPGKAGVVLVFRLLPRPVLGELRFAGNRSKPDSELKKLTGLRLGHSFVSTDLERARGAIRRAYVADGFSRVRVVASTSGDPGKERVAVRFTIEEGDADRVAAVRFAGVDDAEARRLSDVVRLRVGQRYVQGDAEADRERLTAWYRAQGYLAASVRLEAQGFANGQKVLRYTVARGPRIELEFYQLGVPAIGPLRGVLYREVVEVLGTDRRRLRGDGLDAVMTQLDIGAEQGFSSGFREEARIILEDYYRKKGYASVRVLVRQVDPGQTVQPLGGAFPGRLRDRLRGVRGEEPVEKKFVVTVRLGEQIPIHEVVLKGAEAVDAVTFRELVEEAMSSVAPWGIYTEPAFEQALPVLIDYYRAQGYLEARFSHAQVHFESGPFGERALLEFEVVEGPRTLVGVVAFSGMTVFSPEEILPQLPLKEGRPYSPSQARASQEMLKRLYRDRAHSDVEVFEPVVSRRADGSSEVVFRIVEGSAHTFGERVIQGLRHTRPSVVDRVVSLDEGGAWTPAQVDKLAADLLATGVFRSVEVRPLQGGDTRDDVVIEVTEKVTNQTSLDVGLSVEEWVELAVEFSNNNVWGLGHRLSLRAEVAGMSQTLTRRLLQPEGDDYLQQVYATVAASTGSKLTLSYQQPWLLGLRLDSVYNLSLFERDFKLGYRLYRDAVAWGLKRDLRPGMQVYAHAQVEHRRPFDPLDVRTSALFDIWAVDQEPRLGTSASLGALYANRLGSASGGRSLLATGQVELFQMFACEMPGGQANPWESGLSTCPGEIDKAEQYAKVSGRTTWSEPWLSWLHTELRLQGGYALPFPGSDGAIPVEKRFYLGGATSVRGFMLDSLGPVVVDRSAFSGLTGVYQAVPTGGNAYFAWNAEATVPLDGLGDTWLGWELALFQDGGNALWVGESKDVFLAAVEAAYEAGEGPTYPADRCDPLGPAVRTSYGVGLRYQTPVGPIRLDLARNAAPRCGEPDWRLHFSVGLF